MFEQSFKNIDDILRKDAGMSSELDYTEQSSWLLFLKYLDDLEKDRKDAADLKGEAYTFLLDEAYRWEAWAAPKTWDCRIDHTKAKTGDDLLVRLTTAINNVMETRPLPSSLRRAGQAEERAHFHTTKKARTAGLQNS